MNDEPRHQCSIYAGPPSQQLPAISEILIDRLKAGYRCLYLNSPAMVSGMRSLLAAAGIDVHEQTNIGALSISSDQSHLIDGVFNPEMMITMLVGAAHRSQIEGFVGLWACGDMTWEFGNEKNFYKLLEYECRLEHAIHKTPSLQGICHYHMDTLPADLIKDALFAHEGLYINETLSRLNPYYIPPERLSHSRPDTSHSKLQEMLESLGLSPYPETRVA